MSVRVAATVCTRTTAVLRVTSFYIAMLRALFHLLVLVHHTYVSYHLLTQIDFSKSDDEYVHNVMKKFKLRYFTSWNFVSSILFGLSNVASSTA
jgi:amino acid permease